MSGVPLLRSLLQWPQWLGLWVALAFVLDLSFDVVQSRSRAANGDPIAHTNDSPESTATVRHSSHLLERGAPDNTEVLGWEAPQLVVGATPPAPRVQLGFVDVDRSMTSRATEARQIRGPPI